LRCGPMDCAIVIIVFDLGRQALSARQRLAAPSYTVSP